MTIAQENTPSYQAITALPVTDWWIESEYGYPNDVAPVARYPRRRVGRTVAAKAATKPAASAQVAFNGDRLWAHGFGVVGDATLKAFHGTAAPKGSVVLRTSAQLASISRQLKVSADEGQTFKFIVWARPPGPARSASICPLAVGRQAAAPVVGPVLRRRQELEPALDDPRDPRRQPDSPAHPALRRTRHSSLELADARLVAPKS